MDAIGIAEVLIVDDSDFLVEVIGDELEERYDIRTWTASGGPEALSVLRDRQIDCVVSDYVMPDMDGLALYRRVEKEFDTPFIMLTGAGDESVASEAIGAGVDDYLQKDTIIEGDRLQLLANRIRNVVTQHRARRKYELLVDNTPDEIAEVSIDGEIIAVNEAMATSLETTPGELVGQQLSAVYPEEVAANRIEKGRRATIAGSSVTFQDTIGVRHFHNVVTPLSETTKGTSVHVSREITQQKRDEQALERKSEELAVINRLVRHDINNDVQLLIAWADGVAAHIDEPGMEYVERIRDTCDHIAELTATARDFVDSLESDEDIELQDVDLVDVLEREIDKKRSTFHDAEITVDGQLDTVDVTANELLPSVFGNLLSNAVRHNDKPDPRVTVSTESTGDTVRIEVADNGPGVPDDRKEEIFGKAEMGAESSGTGIGLYLVHTLVEQYGGTVHVEDNTPVGSVFVVELPRATSVTNSTADTVAR